MRPENIRAGSSESKKVKREDDASYQLRKMAIAALGLASLAGSPALAESKIHPVESPDIYTEFNSGGLNGTVDKKNQVLTVNSVPDKTKVNETSYRVSGNIAKDSVDIKGGVKYKITPELFVNASGVVNNSQSTVESSIQNSTTIPGLAKIDATAVLNMSSVNPNTASLSVNAITADEKGSVNFFTGTSGVDISANYKQNSNSGIEVGVGYSEATQTVDTNIGYNINPTNGVNVTYKSGTTDDYKDLSLGIKTDLGNPNVKIDANLSTDTIDKGAKLSGTVSYKLGPNSGITGSIEKSGAYSVGVKTDLGNPNVKLDANLGTDAIDGESKVSGGISYKLGSDTTVSGSIDQAGGYSVGLNISSDGGPALKSMSVHDLKKRIDDAIANRANQNSSTLASGKKDTNG